MGPCILLFMYLVGFAGCGIQIFIFALGDKNVSI